ncbi:MAG: hypothetical protein JW773_05495, partial [Desulfuromonadales bacterium]|nr:hypothetical protein [Desulfuromonadales bacterium]
VTTIARKMVCEWGMSEKIGAVTFGEKEGEVFLGKDMGHVKNYSEATAVTIDNEIQRIVKENYDLTRQLLKDHQQQLIALSELLLEKETLDSAEILKVVFPEGVPDYLKAQVEPGHQADSDDFSFDRAPSDDPSDTAPTLDESTVNQTEDAAVGDSVGEDEAPRG